MKNNKLSLALILLCSASFIVGCGTKNGSSTPISSEQSLTIQEKYGYDFFTKDKVPSTWIADTANKGTIETLSYTTHSYGLEAALEEENIVIEKTLNVYLPYGYATDKQYNVVYLLHGTEGEGDPANMANYWMGEGSNKASTTIKTLDYMFANVLKKDMIIVTPTYYSRVEGKNPTQEQYNALKERIGDTSDEWGKDGEQTLWTRFFGEELVNEIIPLVEKKYSTYLSGDATKENIAATRDHRAYAGLSRGSMTSVNSIMMKHTDAFSYIGSFSGIWADFDHFKQLFDTTWSNYPIKYWYNGNGTADFSLEDHTEFKDKVLSQMSDKFVDGQNYCWVNIKGAAHAYNNWIIQLYNSLQVFFTK